MQTKLTLRLDAALIDRAKAYARKSGKPVSQIVAGYFSLLDDNPEKETSEFTPIVRSLKGSLKGAKVGKKDYHKYREESHLNIFSPEELLLMLESKKASETQ